MNNDDDIIIFNCFGKVCVHMRALSITCQFGIQKNVVEMQTAILIPSPIYKYYRCH